MIKSFDLLLLLILVVCVSFITVKLSNSSQVQQQEQQPQQPHQQPSQVVIVPSTSKGDDRYTRAPRPQRVWDNGPDMDFAPRTPLDPIPTRGLPDAYQQMGVITGADGKVLPLYGRRVAARSDYFNYYTRTDTYNPVALPVTFKKRDCQDNQGCQEVFSGDDIRISPTGEVAKVMLYGLDGLR